MKPNLDTLNANQRSAVEWTDGPLLVLAGPGSGKTLVLTLRSARILQSDPDASMLSLTFTTKAADEMRQRLDALLGGRAERAHLCTFHSFAGDVLRQHGSHVGIQPDFSMLANDEDRIAVLEGVIVNLSCDTSAIPTDRKNLLFLLDRLFAESYNGEPTAPGMVKTPPVDPTTVQGLLRNASIKQPPRFWGIASFCSIAFIEQHRRCPPYSSRLAVCQR